MPLAFLVNDIQSLLRKLYLPSALCLYMFVTCIIVHIHIALEHCMLLVQCISQFSVAQPARVPMMKAHHRSPPSRNYRNTDVFSVLQHHQKYDRDSFTQMICRKKLNDFTSKKKDKLFKNLMDLSLGYSSS